MSNNQNQGNTPKMGGQQGGQTWDKDKAKKPTTGPTAGHTPTTQKPGATQTTGGGGMGGNLGNKNQTPYNPKDKR